MKLLDLFNPVQEQYTTHTSTTKDKTLSKLLFKKKFNLTEQEFQQGLVDEEFYEVKGLDGKLKYSWNVSEQATVQGSSSGMVLEKAKELTKDQEMCEEAAFSCWTFGLFGMPASGSKAIANQTVLALEDAKVPLNDDQWVKAKEQLQTVKEALDKLDTTCKKVFGELESAGPEVQLYKNLSLGINLSNVFSVFHRKKIYIRNSSYIDNIQF